MALSASRALGVVRARGDGRRAIERVVGARRGGWIRRRGVEKGDDDGTSAFVTMRHLDAALGVERADADADAVDRSEVVSVMPVRETGVVDPLVRWDADADALGAGPPWDVRWGAFRFLSTALAIEGSFFIAGVVSPVIGYVEARAPEDVPEDAEKFAADFQRAFEDPTTFSHILLYGEVMQCVLGLMVLGISVAPFAPLPMGWFNDVISSPEEEWNATGRTASSRRKRLQARKALDERAKETGKEIGRAILGTYLAVALVTWILYAAGLRGGEDGGSSSVDVIAKSFEAGPEGVANLVVTTVVLAPVFEELVFRGYVMPTLTKWMSTPVAILVSAVIFALIHQHGVGDTTQLLVIGLVTGLVYARTRNLGASMAVHAAFNAGVIGLFTLWIS